MEFAGSRVAMQGFGNVGSVAAEMAEGLGATVVGISDQGGGLYNPRGFLLRISAAFTKMGML